MQFDSTAFGMFPTKRKGRPKPSFLTRELGWPAYSE